MINEYLVFFLVGYELGFHGFGFGWLNIVESLIGAGYWLFMGSLS